MYKRQAGLKALYEIRIRFLFTKQLSTANIEDLKTASFKVIAYNATAMSESEEASKYYLHFLNNVYTKLQLPLIAIDNEISSITHEAESFYTPMIKANNLFTSETNIEHRIAHVAEILKFSDDPFVHRPVSYTHLDVYKRQVKQLRMLCFTPQSKTATLYGAVSFPVK